MQAVSETSCSFNQVYSMMPYAKSSEYFISNGNEWNAVGSKQDGERERKRGAN